MAGISMCTNSQCPNAGHCYRVQAKPSDWQSYIQFEYQIGPNGVVCENYLPVYRTYATGSTG